MNNEKSKKDGGKTLYTLIPLEDFKGLVGIDDRDDRLARFCLITSTFTNELYLSPALRVYPRITAIKVIYWAGFKLGSVPPDLATACLELALNIFTTFYIF